MNRKNRSIFASLLVLALFGVLGGCRETPITSKPNIPTVFVGEINGVVRNGNTGAPLSGVTVTLLGTATDAGGPNPVTATTDANGLYVFRNLDAGTYKIAATAPAGFAPTRVQDGPELRSLTGMNEGGVVVTRTARDIRFFTANASISATAFFTTPFGQVLPVPAGTRVFVNFARFEVDDAQTTAPARQNPTGETIGDVQVALVEDSVRAGGAITITGLPAVGVLADIDISHRPLLIVPNFVAGGVAYGNANGRAIELRIAGLRPGTPAVVSPTVTQVGALISPTALTATNLNSRTNFVTTDTMFVAFNKPMSRTSFQLVRVRTPYSGLASGAPTEGVTTEIASTGAGSLTATPVAAGAVAALGGITVGANQAFAIRLNRPFITGSEHRLDFDVTATDGSTFSATNTVSANTIGVRSFTTIAGLRLLSVTAGSVAAPITLSPTATTANVPITGVITFTFDRAPVGSYFTRGALQNVRFASGSETPGQGTTELGRVGIAGETNRIDCVGVITGNAIAFGYRSLVGATANAQVGTTYQTHASLVSFGAGDQPISNDATAPGTLGNFRSSTPGDYGIGAVLTNRASEFSSFRAFVPTVNPVNIPRIVSVQLPRNPLDSIRVAFSIPMRRTGGTVNTTNGFRIFRSDFTYDAVGVAGTTATNQPYGLDVGLRFTIPITITSSSGDTVFFLNRNQRRDVDGVAIPFEGNTSYTFQIDDDLESAPGVRLRGDGPALAGGWFTFQARTSGLTLTTANVGDLTGTTGRRSVSGTVAALEDGTGAPVPTSGTIELVFSEAVRDVEYRTRGLGQNFELVRTSAVGNPSDTVRASTDSLGPDATVLFVDVLGTRDGATVRFPYRGLHRRTRYALRAINWAPTHFISTGTSRADIPPAFVNVRAAAFPNDIGAGFDTTGGIVGYNRAVGSSINVAFITQEAPPASVTFASTNDNPTAYPLVTGTEQTSPVNPIILRFDREMVRNAGDAFTLTRVASPYGLSLTDTVRLRATWNTGTNPGTEVSLVPSTNVSGDTAQTLEAGTTYRLEVSTTRLGAADGGALVRLIRPIVFTTQPQLRITGVTVRGQGFSAPGLPINAGGTDGAIVLTFNQAIGGRYAVRGPNSRFAIVEDSSSRVLDTLHATAGDGTVGSVTDTTRGAFVDSLAVVGGTGNTTLTINYNISRSRLRGRAVIDTTNDKNGSGQNPNRIIRFSIRNTSFGNYANLLANPLPSNIRGVVRGDLGVGGVTGFGATPPATGATFTATGFGNLPRPQLQVGTDGYTNEIPGYLGSGRNTFAFYFSTGGTPASSSFPDMIVTTANNAVQAVSSATKNAVSSVRSWFKRVTE